VAETTSGGTPSRAKKEYYRGNIPWVKSGELKDNIINTTAETITNKGLQNSSAKLFNKGTLLVALYGATVGKTGILGIDATTNQAICAIIPQQNKLEPRFLMYEIIARRSELISASSGGAQPNISQGIVRGMRIPIPPLQEQHGIAKVLSTVDDAIQKTVEITDATERLKSNMLDQLLTKGVGHTEFQETDIGLVPKGWEIVPLERVVKDIKHGFASGKRDENGVVQIRMNNVTTDGRLIFDSYLKVPVPPHFRDFLLKRDDLLFNNTNSIDLVGKSAIFKDAPFPCVFSNHFTRIRFKEDLALPEFVLCHFVTLWKKGYFKSVAIRHVGQSAVHTKYILGIRIPLPPISEQRRIIEILSTTDRKLELERNEKAKLEEARKGLMNLLLTGEIRIKVQ